MTNVGDIYRQATEEATEPPRSAWSGAELGVHFVDDLIAVQRSPNGHVWYMPAYARACVRISRVYDWERLVRHLLRGRLKRGSAARSHTR